MLGRGKKNREEDFSVTSGFTFWQESQNMKELEEKTLEIIAKQSNSLEETF